MRPRRQRGRRKTATHFSWNCFSAAIRGTASSRMRKKPRARRRRDRRESAASLSLCWQAAKLRSAARRRGELGDWWTGGALQYPHPLPLPTGGGGRHRSRIPSPLWGAVRGGGETGASPCRACPSLLSRFAGEELTLERRRGLRLGHLLPQREGGRRRAARLCSGTPCDVTWTSRISGLRRAARLPAPSPAWQLRRTGEFDDPDRPV